MFSGPGRGVRLGAGGNYALLFVHGGTGASVDFSRGDNTLPLVHGGTWPSEYLAWRDDALLRVAVIINLSRSVDPSTARGSRLLFPMLYAAMVRAGSIVMLAEAIGSIAAERAVAPWGCPLIVSGGTVNEFSIVVDVAVMPGQVAFVGSEAPGLY